MSEYWKSQPRKFCDFCKCWITENKPSIDFHEKGKRHQENVKLKIEQVKKKGIADEKKKQKDSDYLKQMERAALKAFKKDLANDPELARQYSNEAPKIYEGPQLPEGYSPELSCISDATPEKSQSETASQKGEWYETMSEIGYPYYWNTLTGESLWVPPANYVSLADQGLDPTPLGSRVLQHADSEPDCPNAPQVDAIPLPGQELSPSPGEESAPSPDDSESEDEEVDRQQDRNARGVYGVWSRVQQETQNAVDLELPNVSVANVQTIAVPISAEEVKLHFKEKTAVCSGSNKVGPIAFKKRKLGEGARNVRRRNSDVD